MIVLVIGLPGSGKSYFAMKLAELLGARYVSSDITRRLMFNDRTYSDEEKSIVYDEMQDQVKLSIENNASVVLDATFYLADIRLPFLHLAESYDQRIEIIEIQAADEIIKERLAASRHYSEADYAVYLKIKEAFETCTIDHLVLQSTQENINEMLMKAMHYIGMTHE